MGLNTPPPMVNTMILRLQAQRRWALRTVTAPDTVEEETPQGHGGARGSRRPSASAGYARFVRGDH
jgi:hypothetical protein